MWVSRSADANQEILWEILEVNFSNVQIRDAIFHTPRYLLHNIHKLIKAHLKFFTFCVCACDGTPYMAQTELIIFQMHFTILKTWQWEVGIFWLLLIVNKRYCTWKQTKWLNEWYIYIMLTLCLQEATEKISCSEWKAADSSFCIILLIGSNFCSFWFLPFNF